MVVVVLEKCPQALRGDLTKWLQEVSLGVFVGRLSARVRDNLWERICEEAKSGRATMVFSAQNEQHLDFYVHNTTWEPIDFDGLKLIMRPSVGRLKRTAQDRQYMSDARKRLLANKRQARRRTEEPSGYVVVDLETTGLDDRKDSIIELGAIKILNGEEVERLQLLVNPQMNIPQAIQALTGITPEMQTSGVSEKEASDQFIRFIGNLPLVMHNSAFDMGFIDAMLEREEIDELENECIDTLRLSRKRLPKLNSHALASLVAYFEVASEIQHRAIEDALLTREVFLKLIEI